MGNLLAGLMRDKSVAYDMFLDFENAQPGDDDERITYDKVSQLFHDAPMVLEQLGSYAGATDLIRQAIANPANENATWQQLIPLISQLKYFYEFSNNLSEVIPLLLKALCTDDPARALEEKQSLTKMFAEVLQFVLTFDELKMTNPAIQNDFAYYRRQLGRRKTDGSTPESVVSEALANKMTLFYASPTPMLIVTNNTTTKFVNEEGGVPSENVTNCLSVMAAVCKEMVDSPDAAARFKSKDTIMFCLRVMVGVIILFDHIHPTGAFNKKATIDIRGSIRLLKDPSRSTEGLVNALKFTTKHLNAEDTPKSIKALLDA